MYKAGLYMRLSKDDGTTESSSIANQRKMLQQYANQNNILVIQEYIDDGFSGTNFDRPAFKQMINDVNSKKINMIITKDLSRLGRDYITTGQYTEILFPHMGVRYVAINDGYDSENQNNDIAPFKNVINEMYARDTSKKIKSAFISKMKEGSFIGNFAPYGYQKDINNKNHLVIDYETSCIVKQIFLMASEGHRPKDIADYLNSKNILSPIAYRCLVHKHLNPLNYKGRQKWTSSTIVKILSNIVYIGHTAQGKTLKTSLKSKTSIKKAKDEWYIVENTHESIISKQLFDIVNKRSVSRKKTNNTGFTNVFSGICKCDTCSANMSTTVTRKKHAIYNLVCGKYKLYGKQKCTNHFIDYNSLYQVVCSEIKEFFLLSDEQKSYILENRVNNKNQQSSILNLENRIVELDNLIKKLYEYSILGKINDDRFIKLTKAYEDEQIEIYEKIHIISKSNSQNNNINDILNIKKLTPKLIKAVIDKIIIEQGNYQNINGINKKIQKIKIYWK